MAHYLYILYSESRGKYYIGQTDNIQSRLHYHNSGYVFSTKSGRPWRIVFCKEFPDRSSAMQEEARLKRARKKAYLEWYIANG